MTLKRSLLLSLNEKQGDLTVVNEELIPPALDRHPAAVPSPLPLDLGSRKRKDGRGTEVDADGGFVDLLPHGWRRSSRRLLRLCGQHRPRILLTEKLLEAINPLSRIGPRKLLPEIFHQPSHLGQGDFTEHIFRHGQSPFFDYAAIMIRTIPICSGQRFEPEASNQSAILNRK